MLNGHMKPGNTLPAMRQPATQPSRRCIGSAFASPNRSQSSQRTQQQPPYKHNGVTRQRVALQCVCKRILLAFEQFASFTWTASPPATIKNQDMDCHRHFVLGSKEPVVFSQKCRLIECVNGMLRLLPQLRARTASVEWSLKLCFRHKL